MESNSPFSSVRRIVTGHNSSGKSIILRDEVQKPKYWPPGNKNPLHELYFTTESPAIIDTELSQGEWIDEITRNQDFIIKNGSKFISFDLAPGFASPFHRTISIDYGIVAKGSLVLELDDGKHVTMNEGDVVAQRGTIHSWKNETNEWARIYFIVLDAKPIEVNGETLSGDNPVPTNK